MNDCTASGRGYLGRAPWALSILLLVAAAIATVTALAMPDLVHGPAVMVGSMRGTDLVVLVLAIPILALAMAAARHASLLSRSSPSRHLVPATDIVDHDLVECPPSPCSVVLCDFDGECVRVNTMRGFQKERNMRRDPRITLLCYDPRDDLRYLEIRGSVIEMTEGESAVAQTTEDPAILTSSQSVVRAVSHACPLVAEAHVSLLPGDEVLDCLGSNEQFLRPGCT